jgi:hypothetical protein
VRIALHTTTSGYKHAVFISLALCGGQTWVIHCIKAFSKNLGLERRSHAHTTVVAHTQQQDGTAINVLHIFNPSFICGMGKTSRYNKAVIT